MSDETQAQEFTFEFNPPYVGSPFSPEVDITDTEEGHTVTITDARGEHSYVVPDWSDEENTRIANENARISAENARVAAETARAGAEASRETAEASREAAEGEREDTFETNEAERQSTFETAEAGRASAETARVAAESGRVSAETSRVNAESSRVSAESARASAESSRASAETARDSAESSRASAETARVSAESTRDSNETARKNAETARASAETSRASAETSRASAESARVSAESGRVSAENGRVTAESSRVAAEEAREAYAESLEDVIDHKAEIDGYVSELVAGASDNLTPRETSEQSFMFRASNAEDDTVAGIEVVKGNTVVWNQLVGDANISTTPYQGITPSKSNGRVAVVGTFNTTSTNRTNFITVTGLTAGHVYLVATRDYTASPSNNANIVVLDGYTQKRSLNASDAFLLTLTSTAIRWGTVPADPAYTYDCSFIPQLFDLTQAFGAGNEPATVAEFEALFPDSYYAYDAGSLLNVDIRGFEGVGFNQWDEDWELGGINTDGEDTSSTQMYRSKNYIELIDGADYYFMMGGSYTIGLRFYDAGKNYIGRHTLTASSALTRGNASLPTGTKFLRFANTTANIYKNDICINLSDPIRNGTYSPYAHSIREIDTSEYFEGGMKSAGSVYDELTSDAAVQRIGSVDLSSIAWSLNGSYWAHWTALPNCKLPSDSGNRASIVHATLPTISYNNVASNVGIGIGANGYMLCNNGSTTDKPTGILYYALATPTTTPIDPPLNLTFKSYEGGTERILVDTTQTAPQSAPPKLLMGYGDTARTIRDKALSVIAMVEKPKAKANHAANTYLILNGKLYKATSAIATGESITPGTNVTETTVMAELLARL